MMDVLAAKGSVLIMKFLRIKEKPITIPEVNQFFNSESSKDHLTTATIYRRVKELELVGMISKDEVNKIFLTDYGKNCLLDIQGEEKPLKKSRRGILNLIQKKEEISMQEIQNYGYSPVTIQKSVNELEELELVEKNQQESSLQLHKKVGRPKKVMKITKKGKNYIKKQEKLGKDRKK